MNTKRKVESYIDAATEWQAGLRKLRKILLAAELDEAIKWNFPCYTHGGKNVVGLGAFKSYFGLWFYQGALLDDPERVLVNAQEGKTKAMRQWRFNSAAAIKPTLVKRYVTEAVALAAAGREIKVERNKPITVPEELLEALRGSKKAESAFEGLTPGKRREYADYIALAKRDATKSSRIKKILPMIMAGRGLNDKYR